MLAPSKSSIAIRRAILAMLKMSALPDFQIACFIGHLALRFLRDIASATQMLLGIFVVDEKLAVLAVAVGLVTGGRDHIENARCLVEDCVHLLQGAVCGFRVEEVNNGEDECVAIERLVMSQYKCSQDILTSLQR